MFLAQDKAALLTACRHALTQACHCSSNVLRNCVQVGIVQTAYANGASTRFIREGLQLETVVTLTGVKHLHAAAEAFDIGIYFEANGHGTILFQPQLIKRLHKVRMGLKTLRGCWCIRDRVCMEMEGVQMRCMQSCMVMRLCCRGWSTGIGALAATCTSRLCIVIITAVDAVHTHVSNLQLGDKCKAAKDLLALVDMINQAVGDALSGILLVEAALSRRQWGLNEWVTLYDDLPSRQLKVCLCLRRPKCHIGVFSLPPFALMAHKLCRRHRGMAGNESLQ